MRPPHPRHRLVLLVLGACADAARDDDAVDTDPADSEPAVEDTSSDTGAVLDDLEVVLTDVPIDLSDEGAGVLKGYLRKDFGVWPQRAQVTVADADGPLVSGAVDAADRFELTLPPLAAGMHDLEVVARLGRHRGRAEVTLPVCAWPALQDFDANPIGQGWRAFGDATWDPSGWMELTGAAFDRSGSVYLVDRRVDPGDVRLEFRIATGGGVEGGADGYAVNVVDVPTVEDLAAYVAAAQPGACLGYASGDDCPGTNPHLAVEGFHVEFDTWWNPGTDPTQATHVALTLDGDHRNHVLWAEVPLEDLQWRQVVVETRGEHVRVDLDGVTVLDGDLPGFRFEGGWIGLSGSTGGATNLHRFDDLRVLDRCVVPGG